MRIVLASASPRRRDLLQAFGLSFDVLPPDIPEVRTGDPAEAVLANARAKARAVAEQVWDGALYLGVDTDVALDGRLLAKADPEPDGRERLEALAGGPDAVPSGL